jgi:hypothetical protein
MRALACFIPVLSRIATFLWSWYLDENSTATPCRGFGNLQSMLHRLIQLHLVDGSLQASRPSTCLVLSTTEKCDLLLCRRIELLMGRLFVPGSMSENTTTKPTSASKWSLVSLLPFWLAMVARTLPAETLHWAPSSFGIKRRVFLSCFLLRALVGFSDGQISNGSHCKVAC